VLVGEGGSRIVGGLRLESTVGREWSYKGGGSGVKSSFARPEVRGKASFALRGVRGTSGDKKGLQLELPIQKIG